MKAKSMLVLAAAAGIALAGAVAVTWQGPTSRPEAGVGELLYPALASRLNEVGSIVVAKNDETFVFERKGDTWVAASRNDYPADFERLRKLLVEIASLRTVEAKTSSAAGYRALEVEDLSEAGAKSIRVTLKDGGGAELASLYIGKSRFATGRPEGDGVYVRKAAETRSWLARNRMSVDRDIARWLDRKLTDLAQDRVQRLTVVQADGARLEINRATPADKDFAVESPPTERKLKPAYDIDAVATAFSSLEFDDFAPATGIEFPANAPATEVMTFDGVTVTATFAEKNGKTWIRFAAKFAAPSPPINPDDEPAKNLLSPEAAAKQADDINRRLGGWAYTVSSWKLETLRRKLDDLLEAKAS